MAQSPAPSSISIQPKFSKLLNTQTVVIQGGTEKDQKTKRQNQQKRSNLLRATSQDKFARKGMPSGQKRVRLRDYLFVAKSSLEKNNEKMKQLKKSVPDKGAIAENAQKIKRNKYNLSNKEIHDIVKKEVEKEMENVIKSMQQDVDFIKNLDLQHVANEDLIYLHEVRGILAYKIAPALKEINQISLKRQGNLFKQIISLGQNLARSNKPNNHYQQSKTPTKVKIQKQDVKSPIKQMQREEQPSNLSPKMTKPPAITPNKFFESLMNSKNPYI